MVSFLFRNKRYVLPSHDDDDDDDDDDDTVLQVIPIIH